MNKLVFIMDDSPSFLNDEAERIYKEWGFEQSNVIRVETWNAKYSKKRPTLLGEMKMTHLNLEDKRDLKEFATLVKSAKKNNLFNGEWWGYGLIITATTPVGAKSIEKLVVDSKGEVVKKGKPEEQLKLLLDRINLNRDTRELVENYVGREYNMLVSPVREIEKYPIERQKAMTADEVIVMLPTIPGNIPPWEFADLMMSGNGGKAIEVLERILLHDHPLVPLVFIKRKADLLYKLKVLNTAGVWQSKEQAAIIGERNGPNIWNTDKVAKNLSMETVKSITLATAMLEVQMKGWSSVKPNDLLLNHVAMVSHAIRYNKPIPERVIR